MPLKLRDSLISVIGFPTFCNFFYFVDLEKIVTFSISNKAFYTDRTVHTTGFQSLNVGHGWDGRRITCIASEDC